MSCRRSVGAGLAVLTLALATACANQAASSPPEPSQSASSASLTAAPTPTATAAPTGRTVSLDKQYRYPDGLSVAVVEIAHATLGDFVSTEDPNAKVGDPFTIVTIEIHNGSDQEIRPMVVASLFYGKDQKRAARVDCELCLDGPFIEPGKSAPLLDMAYLIPIDERDQVRLEVALNIDDHEPAQFTGSVARARKI